MKAFKFKAVAYPLVGIVHIVFWKSLPNPVLAAVIAVGCFALGIINLNKWIESK